MEANLIVTYEPSHAQRAERELLAVAGKEAKTTVSGIEGLFLLKTKSDPKKFVHKIREILEKDSSALSYTNNWIPVESWCSSSLDVLVGEMKKMNERLDEKKSWKIEISKRHYPVGVSELVKKLTAPIDKQNVDLGQPEQIVRVEILGDRAGIALLAPEDILNIREFVKK